LVLFVSHHGLTASHDAARAAAFPIGATSLREHVKHVFSAGIITGHHHTNTRVHLRTCIDFEGITTSRYTTGRVTGPFAIATSEALITLTLPIIKTARRVIGIALVCRQAGAFDFSNLVGHQIGGRLAYVAATRTCAVTLAAGATSHREHVLQNSHCKGTHTFGVARFASHHHPKHCDRHSTGSHFMHRAASTSATSLAVGFLNFANSACACVLQAHVTFVVGYRFKFTTCRTTLGLVQAHTHNLKLGVW
jgi:hypothetical protein